MISDFRAAGVEVYGVSPNSPRSHERFAAKCDLGIPLVSDPDHVLIGALGLWAEKSMYGRTYHGVERSTFLVGDDGAIEREWRQVKAGGHAAEVLEAARPCRVQDRARPAPAGLLDALLDRRIIFVAGKGGAARPAWRQRSACSPSQRGKDVLGVEVDAKGDLAAALGPKGSSFKPEVVQPRVSVLALHAEESFQEYLRIYFKVPRLARITPLSRGLRLHRHRGPGSARHARWTGKIAFEERRRDNAKQSGPGTSSWSTAAPAATSSPSSGPPAACSELVRGGVIRSQIEWINSVMPDAPAHHGGAHRPPGGDACRGDDRA